MRRKSALICIAGVAALLRHHQRQPARGPQRQAFALDGVARDRAQPFPRRGRQVHELMAVEAGHGAVPVAVTLKFAEVPMTLVLLVG